MNQETRFSGHWIVAAQGTGKTNLLLHMLASDLQRDAAVIVMDPKGDLTGPIRNLALGDRLIVLDPHYPFAINPLDVPRTNIKRAVNQLEYVFGALLDASVTPKQKSFLRSILRAAIIAFPEPNLYTIQHLVTHGWKKYELYIPLLPPDLQDFFYVEWKDYDATRSELKWRMRLMIENPIVEKLFAAPRTRFHIAEAMDRGDVFVIDNAIEHLDEDGSAFLGRFFIAQIWAAAMARSSRPRHQKKPVYVYIDECHVVIKRDAIIASIIDMCRSQNIALILSHQRVSQIEEPNVRSALENCAIKTANVGAEADYFSDLLHIPEERINQLPIGHFAMHVRGEGSSIVKVPLAELPYRMMTEAERRAHRQRMDALYGYTPPSGTPEPPSGGSSAYRSAPRTEDKSEPIRRTRQSNAAPTISKAAPDPHTGAHTEPAPKWGDS